MLVWLALPTAFGADADLMPLVHDAATEFSVPEPLLAALVWEASHFDPDVTRGWAGYGPLDLRDGRDPDVEDAAILLGISADALIDDPRENLRGGAALLRDQMLRANDGVLPATTDLEAWWPAVKVFSGSPDPKFQRLFASYVFEQVWQGVDATAATGERVRFGGQPIDLPGLLALDKMPFVPMLPANVDSYVADAWVSASSSNYTNDSRSGSDIEYIIIHTMQGSYSGSISWFQNSAASVSAHYCIRSSDGEITQMVREADIGWHAGNWTYNELSIGIEHEGYVEDPGTWYTTDMYQESALLASDIAARTDVSPDRTSIIGHVEVPGATHTDPGDGWDWDTYMAMVNGSLTIAGDLTGVVADEDIFTGDRLIGATVWIAETGDTTTTDETGEYVFPGLPEGTYTVWADAPGYLQGECEKTIDASGTFWCSIALFPGTDPTTGPTGTEPTNTGPTGTGGTGGEDTDSPTGGSPRVAQDASGGCGCAHGGGGAAWLGLVAALLVGRRRR